MFGTKADVTGTQVEKRSNPSKKIQVMLLPPLVISTIMAIQLTTAGRVAMELVKTKNTYVIQIAEPKKGIRHQGTTVAKQASFENVVCGSCQNNASWNMHESSSFFSCGGSCRPGASNQSIHRFLLENSDPQKNHNGIDWISKKSGA